MLVRAAAEAVPEVEAAAMELAAAQVGDAVEATMAEAEEAEMEVSMAQEQMELAGLAAVDGGAEVQEVEAGGFQVVDHNRVFDPGRDREFSKSRFWRGSELDKYNLDFV